MGGILVSMVILSKEWKIYMKSKKVISKPFIQHVTEMVQLSPSGDCPVHRK